jgi:hypothetical protein
MVETVFNRMFNLNIKPYSILLTVFVLLTVFEMCPYCLFVFEPSSAKITFLHPVHLLTIFPNDRPLFSVRIEVNQR